MISICIIGKNEEKVLDKCLSALMPFGYEIIFIDTGSTDQTKHIALQYTEKVYDFEWINDFSAARNYSISKATYEYILVVDCDEVITEINQSELENYVKNHETGVGRLYRINEFERAGDGFTAGERVGRFFSKALYEYNGTIHEQVVRKDKKEVDYYNIPVKMIHSGYDGNKEIRKTKTERNIRLLKKELEKNSKDTYILYQLGKSYYMEEDYDTALYYFEQALSLDMNPHLEYVQNLVETYGYALIQTQKYDVALGLEGVYDDFAVSADFIFLMGLIYMYNGMFDDAISEFLKATKQKIYKVEGVNSYRAFYNVGVIYECTGHIEEAKVYYKKALPFETAKERLVQL